MVGPGDMVETSMPIAAVTARGEESKPGRRQHRQPPNYAQMQPEPRHATFAAKAAEIDVAGFRLMSDETRPYSYRDKMRHCMDSEPLACFL